MIVRLFALALGLAALPVYGIVYEYQGDLALASATGNPCDQALATKTYRTRVTTAGATGHTLVVNFLQPEAKGFLHNVTFVGLLGPDGDYGGTKSALVGDVRYDIRVEGIVGRDMNYAEISLAAFRGAERLCTGRAEYTGVRF